MEIIEKHIKLKFEKTETIKFYYLQLRWKNIETIDWYTQ